MGRLSVEIEGQVFEPKKLGVFDKVWREIFYTAHAFVVAQYYPNPET